MYTPRLFAYLLGVVLLLQLAHAGGKVELDDVSFRKLLGKTNILVQYVEYSWKTSEGFDDVVTQFEDNDDVLIATVEVKKPTPPSPNYDDLPEDDLDEMEDDYDSFDDYGAGGDKAEHDITIKFFPKGSTEGIDYVGDANAPDDVAEFVHSSLDPQFAELLALVKQFIGSANRDGLVEAGSRIVEDLNEMYQESGKQYVAFMKRIQAKGDEYVDSEIARLGNLVDSTSVKEAKKKEFSSRISRLRTFKREL